MKLGDFMHNKRYRLWAAAALLLIMILGSMIYWSTKEDQQLLHQEEIKARIEQKYEGTITSIARSSQTSYPSYEVKLANAQGSYRLLVHAASGNIEQMTRTAGPEPTPPSAANNQSNEGSEPNPAPSTDHNTSSREEPPSSSGSKNKPNKQAQENETQHPSKALISEQKAKEIALAQVKGKITSIELEEDDDWLVYEIEMDTSDKQEAKLYINAYTGEIISIEWDED